MTKENIGKIFLQVLLQVTIVFILVFVTLPSARSQTPVFVIDTLQPEYNLNDFLSVWEDSSGKAVFKTVNSPATSEFFQPYSKVQPLHNLRGVFWGKITIANHFKQPGLLNNWFLFTGNGSYIDVFVTDWGGRLLEHLKTGELVPAHEKKLATGNRVERVPFSLSAGDTAIVFIRLQVVDYHPPHFNLRLVQNDYPDTHEAFARTRADWFFLGFLGAIMIFSLLLFITTRDRAFLFHALFLFSAIVFMLDIFGLIPDLPVLRDHPKWANYLNYLALTCWDIFLLQFFRSYMHLEVSLPRWDKILKWLIRLRIGFFLLIFTFFVITFNEVLNDHITILYVALHYLVVIAFLVALARLQKARANFLIAATLCFMVGLGVNAYWIANEIPVDRLFSEGAMIGEVLLFSIGLAYRMKQLREEEKEAHRLKDLDELKNQLFANITHEFRTPLTLINGMVEMLQQKTTGMTLRQLQCIRQNSDQLLQLVNRLLDLAKIESGHLQINPARDDFVAYLRQLVEFYQPLAGRKEITLRFLTSLPSMNMDFDAEIMRQIFTNLLSNALKFTPVKGSVTISVKKNSASTKEEITVEVSDTGVGIPAAELAQIFDRFYQSENSASHHGLGTGIGLALTQELVLLTGGNIEVRSKQGEGTTFIVTLPVTQLAQNNGGQPAHARQPELWRPEIPEFFPTPTQAEKPTAYKNLVLVIEDNPHIVEYLRSLLEYHFEVESAFNGKDGIDLALETIPDLIICDVIMPEMSGFEVLKILKKDDRTSHIPIVLLTALASVKDRIEGLERGADAYLGKPFEGRELLAILNNLLEHRQQLQAFFKNKTGVQSGTQKEIAPPEDKFLITLKNILEAHLSDEDFGILQLRRAMAVSRTQLHRKLKALTGMSATEFINYTRLQKATDLLSNPDLHIGEIAYETGFKDPNYFTRLFVKLFGKTPTDYRRELMDDAPAA